MQTFLYDEYDVIVLVATVNNSNRTSGDKEFQTAVCGCYFPIQIGTKFDFMIGVLNDLSDFIQRGSLGGQ